MTTPTAPLLDPYKINISGGNMSNLLQPANASLLNNYSSTPTVSKTAVPLQSAPLSVNTTPSLPQISTSASATPYREQSGDTLSAIASKNGMSLKDLLALNPQYQANPNLIKVGENITIGGKSNQSTASLLQPAVNPMPQTYNPTSNNYNPASSTYNPQNVVDNPQQQSQTTPTIPTLNKTTSSSNVGISAQPTPTAPVAPKLTSTGETINPSTGGIEQVSTAMVGGGTSMPATPNIGASMSTPGYESALASYENNLNLTPEEIANQEEINKLQESFRKAYTGEGDRTIPLEFITGRQQSLEQRNLDLANPLQAKAALLQAKRTAALAASQFKVEQEAAKIDRATEAAKPISGTSFYDPTTKSFITAPSEKAADQFTLGEGQVRYDASGNIVASNVGGGQDSNIVSSDAAYWSSLIKAGKAKLADVPNDMRTEVARAQATLGGLDKASQDAIEQAGVVMSFIDETNPLINGFTTGITGKIQAGIPGTASYNLEKKIDTIKANVGFSALQAMRAASPTGGALGQVSENENKLLQSTLGSLDIGQSETQLKENLAKIKLHFTNLINILNESAQPLDVGVDSGEGFNW